jgi:hypothetical protein
MLETSTRLEPDAQAGGGFCSSRRRSAGRPCCSCWPSSASGTRSTVVLEVTNSGDENHDLAFEDGRLQTSTLSHGQSQRLDLGTVTRQLESWCTLPFHKTLGMKLHIEVM